MSSNIIHPGSSDERNFRRIRWPSIPLSADPRSERRFLRNGRRPAERGAGVRRPAIGVDQNGPRLYSSCGSVERNVPSVRCWSVYLLLVAFVNQLCGSCCDNGLSQVLRQVVPVVDAEQGGVEHCCQHHRHSDDPGDEPEAPEDSPTHPFHLCVASHLFFISGPRVDVEKNRSTGELAPSPAEHSASFCVSAVVRGEAGPLRPRLSAPPLRAQLQVFRC